MKAHIILSGGGARGAFQAGALNALKDLGVEFLSITGTSIGAINGAFAAQGKLKELEQEWGKARWYSGIFRKYFTKKALKKHITIDGFKTKYTCTIVSLNTGLIYYICNEGALTFTEEDFINTIFASSYIPLPFNLPIKKLRLKRRNKEVELYNVVDGGFRDVTPNTNNEKTIIIHCSPELLPVFSARNPIKVFFRYIAIIFDEINKADIFAKAEVIRPLYHHNKLDFRQKKLRKLYLHGYDTTIKKYGAENT